METAGSSKTLVNICYHIQDDSILRSYRLEGFNSHGISTMVAITTHSYWLMATVYYSVTQGELQFSNERHAGAMT
jgi:hypothetical protein